MINKHLLCILCIAGFSQVSSASELFREPYLGIEAIQTNQRFYSSYQAKQLFAKNLQKYVLMAGFKFSNHFGVELGYGGQPRRGKQHFFLPGQADQLNVIVQDGETVSAESSYRITYPYLGLSASYVSDINIGAGKLKTEAMIGLAQTKVTATSKINDITDVAEITILRNYHKRKVVPILRLSALANLSDRVVLGVSMHYSNMSKFKLTSKESTPNSAYLINMKDSLGIGLSLRMYI